MAYEEILYDVSEGIATVTLNRPAKLNAWTPTMEKEVEQAMHAAGDDDQVRVIVLTGAGRGFCAGADMGQLDSLAQSADSSAAYKKRLSEKGIGAQRNGARADFQKTYSYMPAINKPIIGAINGAAAGLGFVMMLYCDIRFASDQAKFSTAFARRGLIAEHGISWTLPRIVGVSNALDLLYSARLIDAAEALRMGLVNRVIPQDQFAAEVRKYALELATAASPRSMRVIKKQVYNALFQSLAEAIEAANEEMVLSFGSQDFKEGVAHFLEKRVAGIHGEVVLASEAVKGPADPLKQTSDIPVFHIGIPNPMFEGVINLYAIAGDPLTLIDTGIGTPEAWTALDEGLRSHGLAIDQVRQIVLTHKHADHIGQARDIAQHSGARVLVHEDDLEGVVNLDQRHVEFPQLVLGRLRSFGTPEEEIEKRAPFLGKGPRFAKQTAAEPLVDGQKLTISGQDLEVLHTPGHTQGSICLRLGHHLFVGDHVLPTISPNIGAGEMRRSGMLRRYLNSLDRVAQLQTDDLVALPGHGPQFSNLRERVEEMKTHHRDRENAILDALRAGGGKTVYEIAMTMWKKLPAYHLVLGTSEVNAHLEKLVEEGRVVEDGEDVSQVGDWLVVSLDCGEGSTAGVVGPGGVILGGPP